MNKFFRVPRSTEILTKLNFWLRMYVACILKDHLPVKKLSGIVVRLVKTSAEHSVRLSCPTLWTNSRSFSGSINPHWLTLHEFLDISKSSWDTRQRWRLILLGSSWFSPVIPALYCSFYLSRDKIDEKQTLRGRRN